MTEEEKEAIVQLKHYSNITAYWKQEEYTNSEVDSYIKTTLNYIDKLQKENQELKEENTILEGNKIGYKLAIQELEKTIDLIIDDFQAENYFVGMTNKEVREYYKKRKELEE